jgi:hypothetical protein
MLLDAVKIVQIPKNYFMEILGGSGKRKNWNFFVVLL